MTLENDIKNMPEEKVTEEYMLSRIQNVTYYLLENYTTICSITLDNGFSVLGESSCVKAGNFDKSIGERLAYKKAFNNLWPFFGFLLAENGTLGVSNVSN